MKNKNAKLFISFLFSLVFIAVLGCMTVFAEDTLTTTHFKIHFDRTGDNSPNPEITGKSVDEYVEDMALYLETSWSKYVELGYMTPNYSSSNLLDVYIEKRNEGDFGDAQPKTQFNGAYIKINSALNQTQLMYTCAHELFHHFQFEYNSLTMETWWSEGTASLMEDIVFSKTSKLGELYSHYQGKYNENFTRLSYYSVWVMHFLVEYYNSGDLGIIREITENGASLAAVENIILQRKGHTWRDFMREFSVWNLFTGKKFEPGYSKNGELLPTYDNGSIYSDLLFTNDHKKQSFLSIDKSIPPQEAYIEGLSSWYAFFSPSTNATNFPKDLVINASVVHFGGEIMEEHTGSIIIRKQNETSEVIDLHFTKNPSTSSYVAQYRVKNFSSDDLKQVILIVNNSHEHLSANVTYSADLINSSYPQVPLPTGDWPQINHTPGYNYVIVARYSNNTYNLFESTNEMYIDNLYDGKNNLNIVKYSSDDYPEYNCSSKSYMSENGSWILFDEDNETTRSGNGAFLEIVYANYNVKKGTPTSNLPAWPIYEYDISTYYPLPTCSGYNYATMINYNQRQILYLSKKPYTLRYDTDDNEFMLYSDDNFYYNNQDYSCLTYHWENSKWVYKTTTIPFCIQWWGECFRWSNYPLYTAKSATPPNTLFYPGMPIYPQYGDLNGDMHINAGDVSLLQRYVLGLITEFPASYGLKAADVNNDGRVNNGDYTLLQRYILGIINKFPYTISQ